MSRSYRKHPIRGNCGGDHISEKADKQMANRKLRNKVSGRLKNFSAEDLEDYVDFELNDVSNPYSFRKDGMYRF